MIFYHRFSTKFQKSRSTMYRNPFPKDPSYTREIFEVRARDAKHLGKLDDLISQPCIDNIIAIEHADRVTSRAELVQPFLDKCYINNYYIKINWTTGTNRFKYLPDSDPVRNYRDAVAFAKQVHLANRELVELRKRNKYDNLIREILDALEFVNSFPIKPPVQLTLDNHPLLSRSTYYKYVSDKSDLYGTLPNYIGARKDICFTNPIDKKSFLELRK